MLIRIQIKWILFIFIFLFPKTTNKQNKTTKLPPKIVLLLPKMFNWHTHHHSPLHTPLTTHTKKKKNSTKEEEKPIGRKREERLAHTTRTLRLSRKCSIALWWCVVCLCARARLPAIRTGNWMNYNFSLLVKASIDGGIGISVHFICRPLVPKSHHNMETISFNNATTWMAFFLPLLLPIHLPPTNVVALKIIKFGHQKKKHTNW